MTRRFLLPVLLLLVAAGLAMLPETAAITRTVDRPPLAQLGPDPNAALSLVSFANTGFAIADTTFSAAGSVINRFSVPMTVTVTALPTITQSCGSVDGSGACTPAAWTLYLCLSTAQTSLGSRQCRGGQYNQLTFSGSAPGTVAAQSFTSFSVSAGQTLYLFVKGGPRQTSTSSRLCGQTAFAVIGNGSRGQSVQLNSGTAVPRSQIYRNGSGCP